ncbi:hypothetical protein SDC9_147031 [bioreactor metagenome]|uniref:Uncharacterized protein n=1 Tax=bioreactor metagenome TaxID=1076179 RepID=A0A645EDM9_9ZZZZ
MCCRNINTDNVIFLGKICEFVTYCTNICVRDTDAVHRTDDYFSSAAVIVENNGAYFHIFLNAFIISIESSSAPIWYVAASGVFAGT